MVRVKLSPEMNENTMLITEIVLGDILYLLQYVASSLAHDLLRDFSGLLDIKLVLFKINNFFIII